MGINHCDLGRKIDELDKKVKAFRDEQKNERTKVVFVQIIETSSSCLTLISSILCHGEEPFFPCIERCISPNHEVVSGTTQNDKKDDNFLITDINVIGYGLS